MWRTVFCSFTLLFVAITDSSVNGADCSAKLSEHNFLTHHDFKAASEISSNPASAALTTGWCSNDKRDNIIDVMFPQSYGIKGVMIAPPTNKPGTYPTRVLVQYVPNGGTQISNFPFPGGKLEMETNQTTSSSQVNFNSGIPVKQLRFQVTGHIGQPVCLRIDIIGCNVTELCSCQNGGVCLMENLCRCPSGVSGTNCEIKECKPEVLGLGDGRIPASGITSSSVDPLYPLSGLGIDPGNDGWCPSTIDQCPWMQVKLDSPKAVSIFSFQYPIRHESTEKMYMTEFELQYISPLDSSKTFRTFAKNIPSLNGTHYFQVTTVSVVVTDTLRIVASSSVVRACFKLEIYGCDPTQLCDFEFCKNGGLCMGENVCQCPENFYGDRCEQTKNDIMEVNLSFVAIQNNILVTATSSIQFLVHGNVSLQNVTGKLAPVISLTGFDSFIEINSTATPASCINDISECTLGFTIDMDLSFVHLLDGTYIISSGGNLPGHQGIALYYQHHQLYYIVSTSTSTWTLVVNYIPVLNEWQHLEITWNKHLGVEILVNGQSLGSNGRPAGNSGHAISDLCIGCSHGTSSVTMDMMVTSITFWSIDRTALVKAGIKQAPVNGAPIRTGVCGSTPVTATTTSHVTQSHTTWTLTEQPSTSSSVDVPLVTDSLLTTTAAQTSTFSATKGSFVSKTTEGSHLTTTTEPYSTTIITESSSATTTTQSKTTTRVTTVSSITACHDGSIRLFDGRYSRYNITVSSQDPRHPYSELVDVSFDKGWCPASTDQSPWLQVTIERPLAVSELAFNYAETLSGETHMYMSKFELQYRSGPGSGTPLQTFAKDLVSLNETHYMTIATRPPMVTDAFRIVATDAVTRACFKLDVIGCEVLCVADWCLNGGTCVGENVCSCRNHFYGNRCQETASQVDTIAVHENQ